MRRRDFLAAAALAPTIAAAQSPAPTRFQLACMTLPYCGLPAGAGTHRNQERRLQLRRLGHHPPD